MTTDALHKITVAVISDLHFCNARTAGSGSELSHVVLQKLHEGEGKDPWSDLLDLVKKNKLQADFLLCPGDITTHAAHQPLKAAWDGLVTLGQELQSTLVGCATGNHDVCSRLSTDKGKGGPVHELDRPHDFFENLKLLSPAYPLHVYAEKENQQVHRQRRTHYFGNDFVLHEDDQCRIVIFNSCARHTNDESDYERGLIAESALAELREQLDSTASHKINIFLCHHHPMIHTHQGDGSYDFIRRGDQLIECLQKNGDWIIIHGHKHDGKIRYAPSGSSASSPVVFAASSLGAILSQDQLNKYRNQFYLLDIYLPQRGCSRGTVRVWNWHLGSGWSKSVDPTVGLTDGVGFGERRHADELAELVVQHIGTKPAMWDELVASLPFMQNLTPDALDDLLKTLQKRHHIVEDREPRSNLITQIGPGA